MKHSISGQFKDRAAFRSSLFHFIYWLFTLVFLETLLHAVVFGEFGKSFAFALGFSAFFAGVLTAAICLIPKTTRFWGALAVSLVLILLYGSQMVYNSIFGTLYSVSAMQLGGDALTAFWKETLLAMLDDLHVLVLLFVPLAVMLLIRKYRKPVLFSTNAVCWVLLVLAAVLIHMGITASIASGGTGYFTDYYYYHGSDTTTNQAADRFGLLTAMRLEVLGSGEIPEEDYHIEEETTPPADVPEETTAETVPEEPAVVEYNVLEIDFDALNSLTKKKAILAVNDYCASLPGTAKNEYTGLLKDYNLIYICAESFDTGAIHPEVTPTLYRLANEGFIFNNYYTSFPNTTTDGEYSLCLGLYPDITREKTSASFLASLNNHLPYALGNVFSEQADIQSYGYHNYDGSYYNRQRTHPNMGYSMKFAKKGMTFTTTWPASDLEMMEQSVDDYITQEQFHAYYMTFSGHYRYDTTSNLIAKRNWDAVEDLEYTAAGRAYLSCHIELDKALAYLMERLEAEGIADKTAIVLAGDHFPYGLRDAQYSELVGYEIDDFTKFRSTLIFWVGGMEERIEVDEYCCNVDVLPTILNMWGFEYDSRLLAGTDIFSDAPHVAVLSDQSFFNDKVWLNASSGDIRYLVDESELPADYIENMVKQIKAKYTMSVNILNTDYYQFLFDSLSLLAEAEAEATEASAESTEAETQATEPEA